jgi:hypothetical protein
MMKKILDLLRALFISPEFLIFSFSIVLYKYNFQVFSRIGTRIQEETKIWEYLPVLPYLFTYAVINISSKIRSPIEKNKKVLYKWPLYNLLKNRVYISIFICILCCFCSIYIWFFENIKNPSLVGLIFLDSILISGITALTNLFALQKLKEILEIGIKDI